MDKIQMTEEQSYKLLIGWTYTESERKEIITDWKEKGYIKKICTNGNNAYEINPGFAVKGDRKKHNEKD